MSLTIESPTCRFARPRQVNQLAVLTATLFVAGDITTVAVTTAGDLLLGTQLEWSMVTGSGSAIRSNP